MSRRGSAAWRIEGWKIGANIKPIPILSRHSVTPAGPKSIFTPASSSTSALPQTPDIALLPCFATFVPVPATTNAATVDILNVPLPSPPVPHVSTMLPLVDTCCDLSRITSAIPAISSTVSPLSLSAVANAAICDGVALPSMISSITSEDCCFDSDSPDTSIAMASRIMRLFLSQQRDAG